MLHSSLFRGREPRAKAKPFNTGLSFESLESRIALTAGVTNLGLATQAYDSNENLTVFTVAESGQGSTDLNGDGDASDRVLHVLDVPTGTITNLGLQMSGGFLDGNLVAFAVSEEGQGGADLNGDGDTEDAVMHLFDSTTDTISNLNLAWLAGTLELDGNLLALGVHESSQGDTDLNGDGDTLDRVLHLYDASTGTITNVGLDVQGVIGRYGNLVVFGVSEFRQGGTDLNGDGDASDDNVLHVFDATTGTITNLGLGIRSTLHTQLDGNLLAIDVSEGAQGGTDLNSDGDALDTVMHLYDAASGTSTNLGLASPRFAPFSAQSDGNLLAFEVGEDAQGGTDLNGDGDAGDTVLHLFDASTGTTINLGMDVQGSFQLDEFLLAFGVNESRQGGTDLNGDGDAGDTVMHVFDASTGMTTNLGISGGSPVMEGNILAWSVSELSQGGTDLNADGDASDLVMHVFDVTTGTITNVGLEGSTFFSRLDGHMLAFAVSENSQGGIDLNGDRDDLDRVVHVFDVSAGTTTNLGLAISNCGCIQLDGNRISVAINEFHQGGTDLNGDGDDSDAVLHVVDLSLALLDPLAETQKLVDLVEALSLHQGVENRLEGSLQAAQIVLDDLISSNDQAAEKSLSVFITTVESERGASISDEDAVELADLAGLIIDLITPPLG